MFRSMSSRERVLVTLTVCLALLVVPITALAATGTLINLVDGSNATRIAKVTDAGALQVQMRPGFVGGSFFASGPVSTGTGWKSISNFSNGKAGAVTEITVAMNGGTGAAVIQLTFIPLPVATSCASPGAAMKFNFRTVVVPTNDTLQLTFNGQPPSMIVAADKKLCVGMDVLSAPSGSTIRGGFTGYTFVP